MYGFLFNNFMALQYCVMILLYQDNNLPLIKKISGVCLGLCKDLFQYTHKGHRGRTGIEIAQSVRPARMYS
jgi:hypothetical protein